MPELVKFLNDTGLQLIGDWYQGASKVIILCHGFTGDRLEHGKFTQAANTFHEAGFSVLAFDFSGSGDSQDAPLKVESWKSDLGAALNFVRTKGASSIGILGHSLGGLTALNQHSEANCLVVWAPVTNKVADSRSRYSEQDLKQIDENGFINFAVSGDTNRTHVNIPTQMLTDRENINQQILLSDIDVPVLIVHGDSDQDVPILDSRSAINVLNKDSDLVEIAGGTHELVPKLEMFIQPSLEWFKKYL